jgi:hypothetical protein
MKYMIFENVTATGETPKAIFVEIDGENIVIPKSTIHDDSEVYEKGHTGKLIIPKWLAENEELEGEEYEAV